MPKIAGIRMGLKQAHERLAGVVGFEPTVHGIKSRCLTTWLHPKRVVRVFIKLILLCKALSSTFLRWHLYFFIPSQNIT